MMTTSRENLRVIVWVQFFAILILFIYSQFKTEPLQIPAQCDCQCSKQVHFNNDREEVTALMDEMEELKKELSDVRAENLKLRNDNSHVENSEPDHKREVRKYKKIIEAEDRKLDKEIEANRTVVEEDDDDSPYQPEKPDDQDAYRSAVEKLIPKPLDINPRINASSLQCAGQNMSNLILFYIYTAPQNFEQRRWIRETWGSVSEYNNRRLKLIFFVGDLTQDKTSIYPVLLNESSKYGDLVMDKSYLDAYRNLTLKGISALTWISKYCPNVYRVIKVDDDTQVNPYSLVDFLVGQSQITMSEVICKVTQGVGPIRSKKSKYFVSVDEYDQDYYPPYCQGYGYIFPPELIPKLVQTFDPKKIIAMEDVYITGITGQTLGMRLHPLTAMFATVFSRFETFLERITTRPDLIIVGHTHEKRYVDVFWHLAQQRLAFKRKEAQHKL